MADPFAQFKLVSSASPDAQKSDAWAGFRQVSAPSSSGTAEDVVKSVGSGLVKGVVGAVTTPRTVADLTGAGARWVGNQVLGETATNALAKRVAPAWNAATAVHPLFRMFSGPTTAGLTNTIEERITGPLYKPQTTAGEYAGTIAEFAPGALLPGSVATRVGVNVLAPAVTSETAGQMTKGSSLEPFARTVGAVAGGFMPQIAARAYVPVTTDPVRARHVGTLRDEGVTDISAGQATGSARLRYAEEMLGDAPGAGGRATEMARNTHAQFTQAALRRAGINAERATPEVIDQSFARIGQQFDDLAAQSAARLTPTDVNRINGALQTFERMTPPSMQPAVVREIVGDIATHAGQPIPGPVYQRYRSLIETAARSAQDPAVRDSLRQIRMVLDDAVERSLPVSLRGDWRTTRTQYRNMLVIERAAAGAGENAALGFISPEALAQATRAVQGMRNYARGQGDYSNLAHAGVAVLGRMPNSGTAQRTQAMGVAQAVGAAGGAMLGGAPGAALGALGMPIGQAAAGRFIMSGPMQAYLNNAGQVRPNAQGMNPLAASLLGYNSQGQ